MRSTVSIICLAAANAAKTDSLMTSQSRVNQKWNYNNYLYNDDETASQELDLNFDFGARYDIPMGWDKVENFYINQSISLYAGGRQNFWYEAEWFELTLTAWAYPLWWDVMYNQIKLDYVTMSACDNASSMLSVGKVYFEGEVGVQTCESTFYDYVYDEITYSCGLQYYSFGNIFNYLHSHYVYDLYPSSCEEMSAHWHYIVNPNGPTIDDEMAVEDDSTEETSDTTPEDATEEALI